MTQGVLPGPKSLSAHPPARFQFRWMEPLCECPVFITAEHPVPDGPSRVGPLMSPG